MTRRLPLVIVSTVLLVLCASAASAQFDTPDRSFHNATAFRLEGKHQTTPCASCHIKEQYRGTPNTCYDCHWVRRKDDRFQTRLGTQCGQCHRPTSWIDTRWDHGAQAGMTLNASHREIACESCHVNAEFTSVSVTCVSCHQRDYEATTAPSHRAAGFPATCGSCHLPSESTWRQSGGAGFNHAAVFPLVGVHATVDCQSCHRQNVYRGTARECVACHQTDFNAAQNPNHVAGGFPATCESCHRPTDPTWRGSGASFDHNAVFALVGVHASQACVACHRNGQYRGTTRECVGCHQAEYNATQNPNHAAANFSTSCESCHRPTDPEWRGRAFNHNAVFPLVGTHAAQECAACHRNNQYGGTPRTCVGCHQSDYNAARNPNHMAANFPTTCESCHRPTDSRWGGGAFNHNAVFALVGPHASQACTACHQNNQYSGTPRTCVGCHRADYNATRNPNHVTANFPTTCESCHRATDSQWGGGAFNHNAVFPLVGVHASQACTACHRNNQYSGTSRSCVGCHQSDYNATRDPNHASSGFPTTCESCHRAADSGWGQGRFNHTWFPLSGPHNRACAQCHTSAGNYAVFSCTVCHQRGETDSEHRGRNGYRYESTACYSCHPNGRED